MRAVTFAVLGVGNRGIRYGWMQLKYPGEMEVVALADNRRERLVTANKYLHLPEDRLFDSAEAIFSVPKMAEIMIISTQDAQHKEHALKAMELGYDLLLEKPISNKLEDIAVIAEAAKRLGRRVIVCHVLRYTVFYQQAKKLIDSGVIGRVRSVEASEQVAYYHYAHSYVRGNWHSTEASSPMILAKCSHDMDILRWLVGKKCKTISSIGQLSYFKKENAPEGATPRCKDCKVENCIYNAQKFYVSRIPGWPANVLQPEPTEENILKTLDETNYGHCVFLTENDVVDHQTVQMEMEDGITITFQMVAFSNNMTRTLRVYGTEGEIWGDFHERALYYQRFGGKVEKIDLEALCSDFTGHGGGDSQMVYDVIRLYRGDDFDNTFITYLEPSVESHYMAFCAEQSRLEGGKVLSLDEYIAGLNK